MRYSSFVDYYRAVRQQSHAQALAQRSSANAAAVAVVLPSNQRDVILGADEAMLDVSLNALDASQKQFKQAFVALSMILNNVYRNALKLQRKKSVSALRPQSADETKSGPEAKGDKETAETEVSSSAASQRARTVKVTREQCIPDTFHSCRSNVAKAAVALYCMNGIRGVTRRTILYHALAGQLESVAKTIALVGQIKQDAATTVKALAAEIVPNEKAYPVLVQTLLELAELTRDKGPAKLAALVNEPVYLLAVQHLIKHSIFDSIYPYEPLIARYLHDCVAPINVAREQTMIGNQFKLDPARTMGYLLDAIPKTAYRGGSTKSSSGNGCGGSGAHVFDEQRVYEVFVGQPNYIHNVMVTYTPHEGRNYRTITYNDCLYDVVGCSVERTENGQTTRDSILYDNLRWSERLALLPYRAKIKLETMTGAELNAFRSTASLKVSWMENNHECSKIVTFKNGGGGGGGGTGATGTSNKKESASDIVESFDTSD